MTHIKKKLKAVITLMLKKIKIIFKILFSSGTILKHDINDSTIILISSENTDLQNFISDKNNIIKAVNAYTIRENYIKTEDKTKVHKNRLTINVTPITPAKKL